MKDFTIQQLIDELIKIKDKTKPIWLEIDCGNFSRDLSILQVREHIGFVGIENKEKR